jgi:hypothetical protein
VIVLTAEMRAAAARRMGVDDLDPWTVAALVDVLALVERDLPVTCNDVVETPGEPVRCDKKPDGHDTHLGRSSAGWDVIW